MPRDITSQEPLEHLFVGLYGSGEHGADLSDIYEETSVGTGQTVLKYGRVKRGPIAQIQDRFQYGVDRGVTIHVFPEELGVAGLVTESFMIHRARVLGCDLMTLAETIMEFALPPEAGT